MKMDLALKNQQGLMCHKMKLNYLFIKSYSIIRIFGLIYV